MKPASPTDPKNPVNPAHKDSAAQNTTDSQPASADGLPASEEVSDTTPEATTTNQPPTDAAASAEETTDEEDTQEASLADPQASDANTGGYDDTDTSTSSNADVHAL